MDSNHLPEQRVGGDVRAVFWDDFVGQEDVKRRLEVRIQAASAQDRPLDHVLLTAPPGFGKTTLANMIAWRLGRAFKPFVAPVSMAAIRDALQEAEGEALVIFIDEIHLATKREQEDLLTLLEEGFMQSGGERIFHPHLTVIAGTTARDKVIPALYDRFPIKPVFADYTAGDMATIVKGMAERLEVTLPDGVTVALGEATGGTPRNAKGLVLAARDLMDTGAEATIEAIIDLAGVTHDGLNEEHLKYLSLLADSDKGKLGLNPIAAQMQLRTTVVEDMERLLLKRGYVELATGGRALTSKGVARVAKFRKTGE
jgi:Holliday junction DNA helicase RuvB